MKSQFVGFYRNTCGFALLAVVATALTVATGERDFLGTVWFGLLAVCDAVETTRTLYKMYKLECRSRRC